MEPKDCVDTAPKINELFLAIFELFDKFQNLPHEHGDIFLYPVEYSILNNIGDNPGITCKKMANQIRRTPSACNQQIRKLLKKKLIYQKNNLDNYKELNLYLTQEGSEVYEVYKRSLAESNALFEMKVLERFSETELHNFVKMGYECKDFMYDTIKEIYIKYS